VFVAIDVEANSQDSFKRLIRDSVAPEILDSIDGLLSKAK